ncbi:transcriptional regulator, LacI family [Ignavigranum ruoffiae]|uniref:Catabolite control protein A n=1 Tax=Ignavigranum ruoffiae TaxID=89093 RepID=A0A1H9A237_9LACT|nr:catabolite control protein A [Ignavigranum ruoffiae]UPQ85699.1 catabolite control protein A [Ignavigranum ruoffiae]SEP70068.1 transcriptional regulator, LacI family [Ignavigranum ruoffiae]
MDKQTITIYDVAREAGVSMATVSRVVNGNPNVKPSTRKKVSDVIERLQYRPNAVARGLASKKTTTVGVVIPSVTNIFFAALARGIDDIASMYRYNIILANSDENTERKLKVFNSLLASQVDGIIIIGHNLDQRLVDEVKRTHTPVVFAGGVIEDPEINSVVIDYEKATQEVTDLLLKRNRKVGLITGPSEYMNNEVRLNGFKNALAANKIEFNENLIAQADYTEKDGNVILDGFLAEGVDSVVVSQDTIAAAVMNAALDRGMRVPEEFAVFSSNNSIIAELVRPQLSCIQLPLYDIGAVAMRLLTKLMNQEEVDERQVVLPHQLIERGSTL